MGLLLKSAFLFFIGATCGWKAEVLFRRFLSSANPERKWINPGFCVGPYLPLYGVGLCLLYWIAYAGERCLPSGAVWGKVLLILFMGAAMTIMEYISGVLALKVVHVRLWDYSREWGNLQGIICPKFSLLWLAVSAVYCLLVHPHILTALQWLSENLAFSFFIGLFFGIFLIDVAYSVKLVARLRRFAQEYDVVVRLESIKANIRKHYEDTKQRYHFFSPFRSDKTLTEHLSEMRGTFESRRKKR